MGSPGLSNSATATRVGISKPISTGGPTEFDVIKSRELEKVGSLYICCQAYAYFVEILYQKSRSVLFGKKLGYITISLQKIELRFCYHMLLFMGSQIRFEV